MAKKDIGIYKKFSFERLPKIFITDSVLGNKLIPGISRNAFTSDFRVIYTINSLGLREKEIENKDKFKIIFLGDSLTFGEGIPYGYRFSDLIEKEINNVYAINAGVPGYGIHQMYLWLKLYGLSLKPNLVVCSIIPADLSRAIYKRVETMPHLLLEKENDSCIVNERRQQNNQCFVLGFSNILHKSYFYVWARVQLKVWQMKTHLAQRDKEVWDEIRKKGDGGRYNIISEEQKQMVKEEAVKILLDFKNLLSQEGVKFLVMNIAREPIGWLEDFCIQQNIDYLDLSSKLRKASRIKFEIDPHYNLKGNRIIASLLKAFLLQEYKADIENTLELSE